MKLLLLAVLASAAWADLTVPKKSADVSGSAAAESPEEAEAADTAAVAAVFAPLEPAMGEFSGNILCGTEASRLTLKFDKYLKNGRAVIDYAVQSRASGGFMADFILVDGGAPGEYDSSDSAHRFDGLRFKIRGRALTARRAGAKLGPEARLVFDSRWKSVSVSLNDGKGRRCSGTLPRTREARR